MHHGKRRLASHLWLGAAGLALLAGCAAPDGYVAPSFGFAKAYDGQGRAAPVLLSNAMWWKRFRDPTLDALVARALSGNLTLASARERVNQARAEARALSGGASASLSANIRETGSNGSALQQVGTADLGLSWLFDPFGARKAQTRSALAQVEVSEAEAKSAQLLVLYNLANAYVDLRYNQRLLAVRQQDLANRNKTLKLTESFFAADSATRLDILRSQAVVAEIEAQLPALAAAITAKRGEIAVLTGMPPGQLGIDLGKGSQPRPRLSADVGIPADILRNRPDIRVAERLYYAALSNITVARADLYPKLSLSGAINLTAIGRATSKEYFFGPALQVPLLSKAPRAAVEARESQARQALLSWKSTVLTGIQEVESALSAYAGAGRAVAASEKTVKLYTEVVDLTRTLIDSDGATLTDLIDAETAIASANATLAGNLRDLATNFIALNVALGSGNAATAPVQGGG